MKLIAQGQLPKLPTEKLTSLFPRFKEEKTRSFTTLVFTLGAIALFAFLAISPTLSTIADLNKQLDDNKFLEGQLNQKIQNLTTLQQKYTAISSDMPIILTAVPPSANIPNFIGQIQTIGAQTGIELVRVQTFPVDISTAPSPVNTYTAFAFVIDATGTQSTINTFLTKLTGFDRLITIDGISIAQASQTGDSFRLSIKGKAYFKSQ